MINLFFSPLVALIIFFPILALAECQEKFIQTDFLKVSLQKFSDGACFLTVQPHSVPELIYRAFIFRETGKLMVFNSFGPGPIATSTGARVFHFFPRERFPQVSATSHALQIEMSSNFNSVHFDPFSEKVLSSQGMIWKVNPKVNSENQGGVEIEISKGLLLDSGFKLGEDPTSDLTRNSIMIDPQGRTCRLKNSELFKVDSLGESNFRFSDKQLITFLSKKCPHFSK